MKPKVILHDEPISSLDPEMEEEILQVMRGLDAEGMTQIIVNPEMRFAQGPSYYTIDMENGEIIEISDEDEFLQAHKMTKPVDFSSDTCNEKFLFYHIVDVRIYSISR
ncbi:MAG: hypothetical protein LBQ23_01725 [Puniceicoccales bacterium]|jgi:ABC-type polar amino acid transport system ATPase subunit|nr:hypothetical protein [Puniceicoccales bacterium]